jgi:hypothetical protein
MSEKDPQDRPPEGPDALREGLPPEAAEEAHGEEEHPRGTMLLMMLFLILIVGMWGYVYLMMLNRG